MKNSKFYKDNPIDTGFCIKPEGFLDHIVRMLNKIQPISRNFGNMLDIVIIILKWQRFKSTKSLR